MECALRKQSFVAEGESAAVCIHAWEWAISAAAIRTRTNRRDAAAACTGGAYVTAAFGCCHILAAAIGRAASAWG